MGQQIGRLPENWEDLMEEKRRVLHWSAEILARAEDNVDSQDSFLLEYDDTSISVKVNYWLDAHLQKSSCYRLDRSDIAVVTSLPQSKFIQLGNDIKHEMRKNYEKAYQDLRGFNKLVDELAEKQRNIHKEILALELRYTNETEKYRRKFARLRFIVFKNLEKSEKMLFREIKLKKHFIKEICNIDNRYKDLCKKKAEKLIQEFEKTTSTH